MSEYEETAMKPAHLEVTREWNYEGVRIEEMWDGYENEEV